MLCLLPPMPYLCFLASLASFYDSFIPLLHPPLLCLHVGGGLLFLVSLLHECFTFTLFHVSMTRIFAHIWMTPQCWWCYNVLMSHFHIQLTRFLLMNFLTLCFINYVHEIPPAYDPESSRLFCFFFVTYVVKLEQSFLCCDVGNSILDTVYLMLL